MFVVQRPFGAASVQAVKQLTYLFLGFPLALAVVVYVTLPGWEQPPVWVPVLQLVLGAVVFGATETVGFAAPALPPDLPADQARRQAVAIWRHRTILRSAATEAVVLLGCVFSFVAESRWPFVLGFVIGMPLMAHEILPSRRTITKLQQNLERAGARSFLDETVRASSTAGPSIGR